MAWSQPIPQRASTLVRGECQCLEEGEDQGRCLWTSKVRQWSCGNQGAGGGGAVGRQAAGLKQQYCKIALQSPAVGDLAALTVLLASGQSQCNDQVNPSLRNVFFHHRILTGIPTLAQRPQPGKKSRSVCWECCTLRGGWEHPCPQEKEGPFLTKQPFLMADWLYPCSINLPPFRRAKSRVNILYCYLIV